MITIDVFNSVVSREYLPVHMPTDKMDIDPPSQKVMADCSGIIRVVKIQRL